MITAPIPMRRWLQDLLTPAKAVPALSSAAEHRSAPGQVVNKRINVNVTNRVFFFLLKSAQEACGHPIEPQTWPEMRALEAPESIANFIYLFFFLNFLSFFFFLPQPDCFVWGCGGVWWGVDVFLLP